MAGGKRGLCFVWIEGGRRRFSSRLLSNAPAKTDAPAGYFARSGLI